MPSGVLLEPPAADEVEVSIFGPGRGECIVVHVGDGVWITVDSCRNGRTGDHPALDYFDRIGVNVAEDVTLVVATHAHDDHTAGVSAIYKAATSARFATSSAFTTAEFFALTILDEAAAPKITESVRREFRAVLEEVERRPVATAPHLLNLREGVRVVDATLPSSHSVIIRALSPSDQAIHRSKLSVSRAEIEGKPIRISKPDPNEYSIALWIEINNEIALLLGGDLLNGPTACGWRRVHATHESDLKASVVKVPHHGSQNSHYSPMWDDFVRPDALALLAPFRMSQKTSIPTSTDVERILSAVERAFITAKPTTPAPSRELRQAAALLRATGARNIRERDGLPGHVQARTKISSGEFEVRTASPAYELSA
ncbi:MBL fold metallo-hydrolase [uncultured Microbacterium sp.]|uniref:MBL fold metallo-hydrolase n=1 Tax=uncultured Microbacterium sp. TaxID=191216 RepID=UPI0025DAC34E|nr:MBL fold metallo-hydrolase [uncultured Microbacterium sp.]